MHEYQQLYLFEMPKHIIPSPSNCPDGLFGVAVTVISDDGSSATYETDGTVTIKAMGESEPCPR